MATVAEIKEIIAGLREQDAVAKRDIKEIDNSILDLNIKLNATTDPATISQLKSEIRALRDERRTAEETVARLANELRRTGGDLARAESAAAPPPPEPQPPVTASQSAQDDAAKGPNAPEPAQVSPSGRIVAPPDTAAPSNAEIPVTSDTGGDTGTNDPVRTTEQTQSTNTNSTSPGAVIENNSANDSANSSATIEGGTATKDDAASTTTSTKQTDVNAANNNTIKVTAQPNILDDFYSYTYSASVYLMKPEQYTRLLNSSTKKIDGYNLLFQSGGAATNVGGVRSPPSAGGPTEFDYGAQGEAPETLPDGGRSPFFPDDFYIDSVTIENQILGKGTGAAHMATSLKFTVIEPQGITLLDRLYKAVANNEPKSADGKVNYTAALYLMVIRFYGYDQDGNIQLPIKGGLQSDSNTSDPKAAVEKFIPFLITKVNWSIGSKTVSYDFEGAPVGQIQGGYTARGTIPYDVQLSDMTVGGLLGADVKYAPDAPPAATPGKSTTTNKPAPKAVAAAPAPTPAPAKASAAQPKKVVTQGLMGAMNQFQQDLVTRRVYEIADEYSIEFVGIEGLASATDISGAKLQTANTKIDKGKAPMPKATTTSGGTENLNPDKTQVDNVSRSFSITAGQQILQAIELAIRNSEYIGKQSLVTKNPDGSQEVNNTKTDPVKWFNITMSAERLPGGLDRKRNDYAYKIKYTVMPYALKNLDSQYFPYSKFSGVHKSYPFWFTGKNTAVRDYQETLNTMFIMTISGSTPGDSANDRTNRSVTSSMYDIVRYNYSPRSNQSSHGADGATFEPNANAAEVIYNQGDLAEAKVKIVGDPAWIQQGSTFRPITEGTISANAARTGFEPDGTISFDTQDVLFEMLWQRPEDYDLGTGLADPYARTSANDGGKRQPLQSRVYQATKIVSEFKNGAFEQTLNGSILRFPIPNKSNTANPAATAASTGDTDAGRSSSSANKTKETAARTGVNLSDAAAQKARANFAKTDPRRLDTGDGGKRAILGAQGAYKEATFATNAGGAAFGNPSITRQGITAGATVLPAGEPRPPTDGTGRSVSPSDTGGAGNTAQAVGEVPPKLSGRPIAPGSLRARQLELQTARLNAQAGDPNSVTNPANQQVNKGDQ
jgi:Tfp pilus assembly major pilin PilA